MEKEFNIINSLAELFVPNKKVRYYILNKFRKKYDIKEIPEFDEIGEHHWFLSKINFNNNDNIGYMPNLYYYDNMITVDFDKFEIINIPKSSVAFYRESNQISCHKKLMKLTYVANAFLNKYRLGL